jgi:DnaJ-class molecular chaperone
MSYHYKTNNVEYQMCSNCGGKGTVDHKICHGTGYVKKDTLEGLGSS